MSSLLAALKPAKQGLGGGDIISLTRMATQKTLAEPDLELNADVVAALRKGYASPEATADALRARLRQANPHKVWLAVELTRDVLTKAPEATRHVRARVLEEVERVASSPMNRYGSDLKGQQNAKTAAFKLVSEYAGGGLLPGGGGGGRAHGNGIGAEGRATNASSTGAPLRNAAGQGQRRRPKPQERQQPEGAEAEASAVAAAPGPSSSKKPQALRKVTQADRGGGGGEQQPPTSPRAATTSSASPRGGGGDAAGPSGSAAAAAPPPRGRWARVLEAAAAGEATGKRYVQSMCDALMQYASAVARGDDRAATAADAAAASLAKEMVQFNGALERVVAQVATGGSRAGAAAGGDGNSSGSFKSLGGPEAEAVTRRCLATTDAVCAALALHSEIQYAQKSRAAAADKGNGGGAAAGGAHGAAGAAAGSVVAAAASEEDSDDDDDGGLDELASALEAAVVSPVAAIAAVAAAETNPLSLPRVTSNNPFDTSVSVPVAPAPAAAAPTAAAAAAFDDAAFFAAPALVVAPAAPVATSAAPAPSAAADFADLLK